MLNPANRPALVGLLAERLKQPPGHYRGNRSKGSLDQNGYAPDARLDIKGFENTLKLRAEMLGTWGGGPPPPTSKYLDPSYYQRALAGL